MYCSQCGTEVGTKAVFCENCGSRLAQPVTPPTVKVEEPAVDLEERWHQDREKATKSSRLQNLGLRSKPISESAKERARHDLAEIMVVALEHARMTVKESEDSSEFMLQGFDPVQTVGDWQDFMGRLMEAYPIYRPVAGRLFMLDFGGSAAGIARLKEEWKNQNS